MKTNLFKYKKAFQESSTHQRLDKICHRIARFDSIRNHIEGDLSKNCQGMPFKFLSDLSVVCLNSVFWLFNLVSVFKWDSFIQNNFKWQKNFFDLINIIAS